MVLNNFSLLSNKKIGSILLWKNFIKTFKSNKLLSTSIKKKMLMKHPRNSRKMDSLLKWCTDKHPKKKEIKLWLNSEKEKLEYWLLPIYLLEVLMFNKSLWSSTTIYLKRKKPTSIELVDLVDLEERELLLI